MYYTYFYCQVNILAISFCQGKNEFLQPLLEPIKNFSLSNYPQANPDNGTSRQDSCGCVFPFVYYDRIIDTCMKLPGFEPICATSIDSDNGFLTLAYCSDVCPDGPGAQEPFPLPMYPDPYNEPGNCCKFNQIHPYDLEHIAGKMCGPESATMQCNVYLCLIWKGP